MQKFVVVGLVALLSACTKNPAPPAVPAGTATSQPRAEQGTAAAAASSSPTLSDKGIGAVRFGMKLEQAEGAVGEKATLPQPFDPACSMVRFASVPKVRFMIENGVVTRADAEPGVKSALGIGVGDTLAQIRTSQPKAEITPHKYDANGHYVTFPGADGVSALILEEADGKVVKMRAGLQPAVAYVETCG
jgi:hypothetical protein